MKVTIIDHVGTKAGMDYYSSSLANGLINNNCEVILCSNFEDKLSKKIDYKNYYDGHSKSNKFLKLLRLIKAILKSSLIAYKNKSDLVIMHLFSSSIDTLIMVLIPKIFGLKVAVISHDVSSFAGNDNTMFQNLIYNILSDFIIVHNLFSYEELVKNVMIKNPKKIAIIKHGGYLDHIDNKLNKANAREALRLESDSKYVLFFGQIKEVKGLDILLEALSEVPADVKLIIAGKPWKSDFSKYESLIEKHNLSNRIIKMIRFIEDDEREKLFCASDVNVLPYRTIYQSGVLLMAMSHGLPVIASDLPANREIIQNDFNGILFETENHHGLSTKIKSFFESKSLAQNLSVNSLATVKEKYNWNDIALKYVQLLENSTGYTKVV